MKFKTIKVVENALRWVDDSIRVALRSYGKGYRLRDCPRWNHRSVEMEDWGDGRVAVRVRGIFSARRYRAVHDFSCDMTVVFEKKGDTFIWSETVGGIQPPKSALR